MLQGFENRLAGVAATGGEVLYGGLKGVEKESLRVDSDGFLSQTPHPEGLGSALTNRYITTDFSEALLEFVTPAFTTTWEALRCICDIHQFTYAHLGDEMLWTSSMPCRIPADRGIPLARYGTSNVGRMKTIYRRGLGYRYGREMQLIAGVHFNYSLPADFWPVYRDVLGSELEVVDFRSEQYLGMIRNFRKLGDMQTVAILEIILEEEIGHVEAGTRWFRHLCDAQALEPENTYFDRLAHYLGNDIHCPVHYKARLDAGFTSSELHRLERLCTRR